MKSLKSRGWKKVIIEQPFRRAPKNCVIFHQQRKLLSDFFEKVTGFHLKCWNQLFLASLLFLRDFYTFLMYSTKRQWSSGACCLSIWPQKIWLRKSRIQDASTLAQSESVARTVDGSDKGQWTRYQKVGHQTQHCQFSSNTGSRHGVFKPRPERFQVVISNLTQSFSPRLPEGLKFQLNAIL